MATNTFLKIAFVQIVTKKCASSVRLSNAINLRETTVWFGRKKCGKIPGGAGGGGRISSGVSSPLRAPAAFSSATVGGPLFSKTFGTPRLNIGELSLTLSCCKYAEFALLAPPTMPEDLRDVCDNDVSRDSRERCIERVAIVGRWGDERIFPNASDFRFNTDGELSGSSGAALRGELAALLGELFG